MGLGYILAFNKPYFFIYGTFWIIIINIIIANFTLGVLSSIANLKQIDKSMEEAAVSLGASPMTTFHRVVFPLDQDCFSFEYDLLLHEGDDHDQRRDLPRLGEGQAGGHRDHLPRHRWPDGERQCHVHDHLLSDRMVGTDAGGDEAGDREGSGLKGMSASDLRRERPMAETLHLKAGRSQIYPDQPLADGDDPERAVCGARETAF